MAYTRSGPFTNGGAPGISATFLNNVENFLVSLGTSTVNTAATDTHVSSDGSGDVTVKSINFAVGSLHRISAGQDVCLAGETVTIDHNLSVTPDYIGITPVGRPNADNNIIVSDYDSDQFQVSTISDTAVSFLWLALAL
jgi:hypothetical protein